MRSHTIAKTSFKKYMNNSNYLIYILGPMRGKPLFNFPAFDEVSERAWKAGHGVFNPAQLDREAGFDPNTLPSDWDWNTLPEGFDMRTTVTRDLVAIQKCNAYICLPGWEKSTGATAEQKVLAWLGATRLDLDTLEPVKEGTPVVGSNPKDAFGLKKCPLRLLPWTALIPLARVMGLGASKYGPWNWRTDRPRATVYLEAALRHLCALMDGQDLDEESGLPHEAHIMANFAILLDAKAVGSLIDDRPTSGKVVEALKEKPFVPVKIGPVCAP